MAQNLGTLKERPKGLELTTAMGNEHSSLDAGKSWERIAGVKCVKPEQKMLSPANNQNKGLPPDVGMNAGYRKQSRLIA